MAGNSIRCVAKYLYDNGMVNGKTVTIETLSGVKNLILFTFNGKATSVSVEMGRAVLNGKKIPSTLQGESVVDREITVGDKNYNVTLVNVGNPHCVVFKEPEGLNLEKIGPAFENSPLFPERINTEFVRVDNRNELTMRVWERGSGETWACGTGACAVAVAAVLNGFADKNAPVTVHLKGGDLIITYTDKTVYMEGAATLAFTGEVEI